MTPRKLWDRWTKQLILLSGLNDVLRMIELLIIRETNVEADVAEKQGRLTSKTLVLLMQSVEA